MPTQAAIADHLCMNQSEVSRHMKVLGIDWKAASMDEIREAYIAHLRGVAAGRSSLEGLDLAHERALTEQVDREIKLLTLAEKKKQLVNLEQLEPALSRMVVAFRAELLSRDDKLKSELDALYGIDIDRSLIHEHTRNAIAQLARYDPERVGADSPPGGADRAAAGDDHHGLGASVSTPEPEGDSDAGGLQP